MNAFYDWNLLLDEQGGPNHVGNWCYAAFMYDRKKKALHANLLQKYYWHFSHFIHRGAKRIGLSKYTAQIEATAFRNIDGSIAVVLFNGEKDTLPVNLRLDGQLAAFELPGHTAASGVILTV